jgi:hypothetical protein
MATTSSTQSKKRGGVFTTLVFIPKNTIVQPDGTCPPIFRTVNSTYIYVKTIDDNCLYQVTTIIGARKTQVVLPPN